MRPNLRSAAQLSIWFFIHVPGKAAEDGPRVWSSATRMGDQGEVLALAWPSPNPRSHLGLYQWLEVFALVLPLSESFSNRLSKS